MPLADDLAKLKRCHLAVGTPGRLKQLIDEGHLKAKAVKLLVLDEADKLMEGSFVNEVTGIFNQLPVSKQMLSLSATYPEEMLQQLFRYMKNPQLIRLAKTDQVLQGVKQFVMKVSVLFYK